MNILITINAGPVLCRDDQGLICELLTPGSYCRVFGSVERGPDGFRLRAPACLAAEQSARTAGRGEGAGSDV